MMSSCMVCASASDDSICRSCCENLQDDHHDNVRYNRLVYGLRVMRQYGKVPMCIQGDSLYAAPEKSMPERDQEVLFSLEWYWDDHQDSFRIPLS